MRTTYFRPQRVQFNDLSYFDPFAALTLCCFVNVRASTPLTTWLGLVPHMGLSNHSLRLLKDNEECAFLATFRRKNAPSDIGRARLRATDVVFCGELARVHSRARGEWTVPA